ncbi:SecDF P1 head subdomain-containing protein [Kribbella deserti]|uniref:SecDF P1 head subdomain domain-containing protein n=1 Tax=Kribbella deserti TaxID=1926257 RepID=A0ABV6QUQ1_9ACTN
MAAQTPFPPPEYRPPRRNRGPLVLVVVLGLVAVAVLAGAVAVGVILLARVDGSGAGEPTSSTTPRAPRAERGAVEFRRVLKAEPGTCSSPSTGTPAPNGIACGPDGIGYTLGAVELDGSHVSRVDVASSPTGGWTVGLSLTDEGGRKFGQLTADLAAAPPPRNQLAIVVSGRVVSAPSVAEKIIGSHVEISSNFTKEQAEKLAAEITG